jgi:hypothetical protein
MNNTLLLLVASLLSLAVSASAQTTANAYSTRIWMPYNGGDPGASIGVGYGVRIQGGNGPGQHVGALYGIKIDDFTDQAADVSWGIYQSGATLPNKFEGSVTIGGKATVALHTPASSSEACTSGQFSDDANFHYVCVSSGVWKRVALSSF